jgi:hypothetical protein
LSLVEFAARRAKSAALAPRSPTMQRQNSQEQQGSLR